MTGIGYDEGPNTLHRWVEMGNWHVVNYLIKTEPNDVMDTNNFGRTVLHAAVIAGHLTILENLVNINTKESEPLLETTDKAGCTALALVAQINGNTKMAKCMVEKKRDLLKVKTKDDQIPLLLASSRGHKDLTRYLFSETPRDVLSENNGLCAAMFLSDCITAEIFGKFFF